MAQRILSVVLICISILYFPFWVSLALAILGIIYFSFFWEVTLLFLISDLIFAVKESRFFYIEFFSFILIVVILFLIEFIKRKLKFYSK